MRYGSLFSGYGGLDMGVQSVLGGETVWHSEIEPAPVRIHAHHWPDVPNLGDVTKVDWASVEPVDVITGGSPCQDVSAAGKRAGMRAGTRSGLWASMCDAIETIRPRLVVWENVRGAHSAEADSDVEPCALGMGHGSGVLLRATGRVVGDLSELGYDAWWCTVRAADAGACHGRARVFVFAWPAEDPERLRRGAGWVAATGEAPGGWASAVTGGSGGVAEPGATLTLLPTPAVNDMGAAYTPETWDAWTATMQAKHGNGNGHGKSLNIEAQRLLPTPTSMDSLGSRNSTAWRSDPDKPVNIGDTLTDFAWKHDGHNDPRMPANTPIRDWGDYAAAIHRWESLTRPAPAPTQTSKKGTPQLAPAFSEWMMGLPAGHVTSPDIGLTRNEQLKALGNGVVPQQAALATRLWLAAMAERVAA